MTPLFSNPLGAESLANGGLVDTIGSLLGSALRLS